MSNVTRRRLVQGVAWSVPAVTVAGAAPAIAASPDVQPEFEVGNACKAPGNKCNPFDKGYVVPVTFTNNSSKTVYITAVEITRNTSGLNFGLSTFPSLPVAVPADGGTATITFNATHTNSANLAFTLDLAVTWGHTAVGSGDDHEPLTVTVNVGSTPPECC